MSKINDLINKMCPDGVEYRKLNELLEYIQPTKYIVKNTNYSNNYNIPVLTAGQTFILGYTNEKTGIYKASKKNPVIIFDDFTTSNHFVEFDFKVKSSAMKILIPKTKDSFKFIYYCMENITYIPKEHSRQWIQTFSEFKIPLPPIKVQEKIVEILDKFSELETELETELEARKRQYQYWYKKIFKLNQFETYKMTDIFNLKNGFTPSKSNDMFWKNGLIPWFRMEDIREKGGILSDAVQHVTKEAAKGNIFPKNSIIVSTSATIGVHALITTESLSNQRFTYLILKDEYKNKIDMKYIYYYCFLLDQYCLENLNKGNFASVDMNAFKKFEFKIPSLKEQKRIVNILDKFDKLINNISEGLPGEIKLRRKQYEYYRNKLLNFKEVIA